MGLMSEDAPMENERVDPPGPYVVTELSLARLTADEVFAEKDAGRPHPERTPVGPFASRGDADAWALDITGRYGGGSWSIAPLRAPFPATAGGPDPQYVAGAAPDPDATLTIDLRGCARCHGDGHAKLVFRPLAHPVLEGDVVIASHWCPCPTNGEPILLTFRPDPGAAYSASRGLG